MFTCNNCTSTWTGQLACHCAGCHETFSGISTFDKHRTGGHLKGHRRCLEPTKIGLVGVDKGWLCWSLETPILGVV